MRRPRGGNACRTLTQSALTAALLTLLALSLVPFVMMLVLSLKSNAQIFTHFWELPNPVRWDFYSKAYAALIGYIANTAVVAVLTVVGVLALSSLSGYTFARHRFPGREVLYYGILSLLMIPGILTLIPAYMLVKTLQVPAFTFVGHTWGPYALINTRWALILPYIAGGQVFGILLCRGFFQSLPEQLFEAARLDGASEWEIYRRIALPLSRPILATIGIMTSLSVYNDYIWPLVVISDNGLQTFSVGVTKFAGEFNLDYGPTLAGYVIGSVPLLLLFAFGMRYFIQGITSGSLKG